MAAMFFQPEVFAFGFIQLSYSVTRCYGFTFFRQKFSRILRFLVKISLQDLTKKSTMSKVFQEGEQDPRK